MIHRPHPLLYEINTRVWLNSLTSKQDQPCTLDDVPDTFFDQLTELGFDWIWLLSVWATGPVGRQISKSNPGWREEFLDTLPDLKEVDIGGSGFAIASYQVAAEIGGEAALSRFRQKLHDRGIRLMLDFVPNHMGPDHPWVYNHPDYFILGTELDAEKSPQNYTRLTTSKGDKIFAHGRDPYFDGWPDTVQLDYSHPDTIKSMLDVLTYIATQCDGIRCDMAMVILPEVFEQTWHRGAISFWPEAITHIKATHPSFLFMAEVYWNMEWALQQKGFDFTYDKRLYDRLLAAQVIPVRDHLRAERMFANKLVRFLENHDERRAADAFGVDKQKAAAIITYLIPGMRFIHQGQTEGKTKKISPHLVRGPKEDWNNEMWSFYSKLLAVLKMELVHDGDWQLLFPASAWQGNPTHHDFILFQWKDDAGKQLVVVINYSEHQSQCYAPVPDMIGELIILNDLMSDVEYKREVREMIAPGLYLDLAPWQYHVFQVISEPS